MDVFGPLACFCGADQRVERSSLDVIPPTAAQGLFEAVLGKKEIQWRLQEIALLRPIRRSTMRTNETTRIQDPSNGPFDITQFRTQRTTDALQDVGYRLTAYMELTDFARPEDTIPKFEKMFEGRMERGQVWRQPFLGMREMEANLTLPDETQKPILLTRDLGMLPHSWLYDPRMCLHFKAKMKNGVIKVPHQRDVLSQNGVIL